MLEDSGESSELTAWKQGKELEQKQQPAKEKAPQAGEDAREIQRSVDLTVGGLEWHRTSRTQEQWRQCPHPQPLQTQPPRTQQQRQSCHRGSGLPQHRGRGGGGGLDKLTIRMRQGHLQPRLTSLPSPPEWRPRPRTRHRGQHPGARSGDAAQTPKLARPQPPRERKQWRQAGAESAGSAARAWPEAARRRETESLCCSAVC
ncbi:unnamed protein product [Rangifer tarandus platyrhynchus]|uniref:Uncharacterized protein n=2 Tax=Rangifer tarandus platyrhynchus TaxID=3082113 RepID=A0ACB0ENF0_RANTA|nr:unnamed protein product [Rangifer tarandus platyrhynchus]CAI9701656.1 unnamed protein product [Rangifer tarandus platyrhynchus]